MQGNYGNILEQYYLCKSGAQHNDTFQKKHVCHTHHVFCELLFLNFRVPVTNLQNILNSLNRSNSYSNNMVLLKNYKKAYNKELRTNKKMKGPMTNNEAGPSTSGGRGRGRGRRRSRRQRRGRSRQRRQDHRPPSGIRHSSQRRLGPPDLLVVLACWR